jgi:hypothetical protein
MSKSRRFTVEYTHDTDGVIASSESDERSHRLPFARRVLMQKLHQEQSRTAL